MHALFVFAHQDDEVATATRIRFLLRSGATISCAYLTNGEGGHASSRTRDEESRRALACLGVDLSRVLFLGSEHAIPDGSLVEHMDRALELLEARAPEHVDEVYCLAWEGGHADHDASHLVAAAFASHRGIADRCFEMPLYHGHGLPSGFFQTLAPLRAGRGWNARTIAAGEGLAIARLCLAYRSQRRTWLGLLPTAFLRLVISRREWTRPIDFARLHARPHEGRLLYERRFGVPWSKFEPHAREFLSRL